MFSCFYFVLFRFNAVLAQTGKKCMTTLKAWFSAGWLCGHQMLPLLCWHKCIQTMSLYLCFYSVIIFIWCCSLVPRWRALLLGAHGLGEETVEILRQFRDSLHGVLQKRLTWSTAGLTVCSSVLFVLPIGNNCLVLLWPLCSYALSQSGSYVLF